MRMLRVSVFVILAAALAFIGIAPRKIFAQKQTQAHAHRSRHAHALRTRVAPRPTLRTQVVRQQQGGPTPILVASPSLFNDKQQPDGAGPSFIIPVTNTSADTTVHVTSVTTEDTAFNVTTTCTTVAPGASCTITLLVTLADVCSEEVGDILLNSDDPTTPLDLLADVYGSDNNLQVTNLTNANLTAAKLAASLVGAGVTINKVTYTGAAVAAGSFTSSENIIGFTDGVVLSSGSVRNVTGPNCSFGISAENNTAGDTDLSNLIGRDTFDASVLEFDFTPTNPTIRFQYVFASDEYEDFVFDFNDVFAFFVNGKNVALIPQTNTLVSINTVNNGNDGLDADHPEFALIPPVNPTFYLNNDFDVFTSFPFDTEMDGMTVVLTASAPVTPGATNHIKLAIADSRDSDVDSNVFIKAGSLTSSVVSLSPTGLAFGPVNQGSQSATQSVTLTNVGTAALTGVSVSADSNNFTVSNNTCGATVPASGSCTLNVAFSPQSGASIQGSLNFADSAGDSPQPVTLAGTGISGPFVSFSPTSLGFAPIPVENTSPPQTITIKNTGTDVLTINGISATNEDFNIQQGCISGSIPVGGTCTVTVTWTNFADSLPEVGQLLVQDNAPGGQQAVALVGGVTTSTVTVLPTPLAFGNQTVNTTSAPKVVTISNTGTAVVNIPSIIVPPGFAETDNCISSGGLVPPTSSGQTSCTINVTFTPTSAVAFGGNMVITDSATGSPHTVGLSGSGTAAAATLVSIAVTPNPATVGVGGMIQFTATGTFSDQSTKDVTAQSTWTSSGTTFATINAATGLATGVSITDDPVTITATDGNIFGTASLSVTGSGVTLTSVVVTPNPATVSVGNQIQFTATGHFSDGTTRDITTGSTWSSSDTGVATINSETGQATGVAVSDGAITIRATAVGTDIFGTAPLTVNNSPITLVITPPPGGTFGPVNPGGTLPVGVVLTTNQPFTGDVTFSCTITDNEGQPVSTITCQPDPSTVSITPNGPQQVAIQVTTFCKGFISPLGINPGGFGGGLALLLLLSTMLAGTAWTARKNPRWALSFSLFVLLALGGVACNSLPRGPGGVTQPGDYILTISATVNGQTVSAPPVHFHVN